MENTINHNKPPGFPWGFVIGFFIVVAVVPGWLQPAIEAKSVVLIFAGAVGWGLVAWRGETTVHMGWALILPLGYLLISSLWSINPLPGLLRMNWVFASVGIAFGFSKKKEREQIFQGIAWGTSLHALFLLVDVYSGRKIFGSDGAGGLFINSNMAATPLLACIALVLFGEKNIESYIFRWHLPLWYLALFLTMSRFQIGIGCMILLIWASQSFPIKPTWREVPFFLVVAGSLGWMFRIHSWSWLLLLPTIVGCWRLRPEGGPPRRMAPLLAVAISLGMIIGVANSYRTGTFAAAKMIDTGRIPDNDNNWRVRKHYYRIALQGWAENPFWGLGLGSARGEAPRFVDQTLAPNMAGFGDFMRPNNLHSDWLELTMEGGLLLWLAWIVGWYLDQKRVRSSPGIAFLIIGPLILVGILDFPFHKPFAIVFGLVLLLAGTEKSTILSLWERGVAWASALTLILIGFGATWASQLRPTVEQQFRSGLSPTDSLKKSTLMQHISPFDPDLFDLYAKSLIQWGASPAGTLNFKLQVQLLNEALRRDPWDHHLILRRMQLAKQLGDPAVVNTMADRYSIAAPADPDRYLRLAREAGSRGNLAAMDTLIAEAKRQPGWEPKHALAAKVIGEERKLVGN